MRSILNLILLSALCAGVTAKIFAWMEYRPRDCEWGPQVDFCGVKIEEEARVPYLYGDIVVKKKLSNSIRVRYDLRKVMYDFMFDEFQILDRQTGEPTICEYINGFMYENLMPMFGNRNDFPIQPNNAAADCEIKEGTYHAIKVDSTDKLYADTKLDQGWYELDVTFEDDGKSIGSYYGLFQNADNETEI